MRYMYTRSIVAITLSTDDYMSLKSLSKSNKAIDHMLNKEFYAIYQTEKNTILHYWDLNMKGEYSKEIGQFMKILNKFYHVFQRIGIHPYPINDIEYKNNATDPKTFISLTKDSPRLVREFDFHKLQFKKINDPIRNVALKKKKKNKKKNKKEI